MTPPIELWVKAMELKGKVLDVGSMDINGCVRGYCEDYVGVDMRQGRNVDIQALGAALPFRDEFFDHVCCLEMLEHDAYPFRTVKELRRVLKTGGLLVMTARGINFPPHDHPNDYWRFTMEGLRVLCEGMWPVETHEEKNHVGVWVRAQKQ